jgi:hypothetical protein
VNRYKRKFTLSLILLTVIMALSTGCNSSSDDDDNTVDDTLYTVAVKAFSLKADKTVMTNLDSVFFSIDLTHKVIFNADSLPVGTVVTKIIPVITFPTTPSSAVITMSNGVYRTGDVDYLTNPSDSIDFTGDVVLKLVGADKVSTAEYRLKVNVHKMQPDSLAWDELAVSKLPSRFNNPKSQNTVVFKNEVCSFITEADGSQTFATTESMENPLWIKNDISASLPTDAVIEKVVAGDSKLYAKMYSSDTATSDIYESDNGLSWTLSQAPASRAILGCWNDNLIGVAEDTPYLFDAAAGSSEYYEAPAGMMESIENGISNFESFSSKWSSSPTGLFVGRVGTKGVSYAFDGDSWVQISERMPMVLSDATIIPYYVYRQTSTMWVQTELSVLLLIGGKNADGTLNRTVYISYDSGVNWFEASSLLQLPDYIPALYSINSVVVSSPRNGTLSSAWSTKSAANIPSGYRINYTIDGYDISWECPYIYLFGGFNQSGALSTDVWRGVLNRLTFVPLI